MEETFIHSTLLSAVSGVTHGFSTRYGGVSKGPYASLNLAHHVDDKPDHVEVNSARALSALEVVDKQLIRLEQVHGASLVRITQESANQVLSADGCWSEDSDFVLCIMVADCLPILLTDREGSFVAAVHAGWRGTADRIIVNMIDTLMATGREAKNLKVALGPSIGPCCFEIDALVAEKLRASAPGGLGLNIGLESGKYLANLWEINMQQLLACGVPSEGIDVVRECTKCSKKYYSYRRDRGITGRQAGLIGFS